MLLAQTIKFSTKLIKTPLDNHNHKNTNAIIQFLDNIVYIYAKTSSVNNDFIFHCLALEALQY